MITDSQVNVSPMVRPKPGKVLRRAMPALKMTCSLSRFRCRFPRRFPGVDFPVDSPADQFL
jgi:hypothetical protein